MSRDIVWKSGETDRKPKKPKRPPYNARAALARVLRMFALGAIVAACSPVDGPERGICFHGCNEYDDARNPAKLPPPSGFCFPPGSPCRAGK